VDTDPIVLPSNRPADRFYRGGRRITDLRGEPAAGDHEPEDWIASTTSVFAQPDVGPTVLPDGRTLADAVAADPERWLGAAHAARWGSDTRLLVKLLDAGQRLPVHAHPDTPFARQHLGHAHGKAEAWCILEPGTVHLGLRRDVPADELRALVDEQRVEELLALLNPIEVRAGDAVLVPPGQLHAIGEGVLLLEVQEPEDLSILLEWRDFALDGPRDGHLGLGFDRALQATDLVARSAEEVEALVTRGRDAGPVLPAAAGSFFRVDRAAAGTELEAGFAVVVVTAGTGVLSSSAADLQVQAGDTVLVPAAAGPAVLGGGLTALVCRPPAP